LFLPKGKLLRAGDLVVQPELARTLRLLAAEGPEVFYDGEIAAAIVAEMQSGGGFISAEDLASYRPLERRVLRGRYRDLEVLCMAPPSSGGVTLLQILGMLEGFDLARMEPHPAMPIHVMVEAMARAFADRNTYLGDPDFVPMPLQGMLSPAYLVERRGSISMDRATPSHFITAGDVWSFEEESFRRGKALEPSLADTLGAPREPDETTHLSVADEEGSVVALTTTLNGGFGNGVMVRGAGFLLNNEMDDFDAQPGVANMYGLVGGEANAIAPGKRMLSSMCPAIVLREGKPWLVVGARGGPRIITAVLQIIVGMRDFGMDLPSAVAAQRIHHQWKPDVLYYEEDALPGEATDFLRRMGHTLQMWPPGKSSVQCLEVMSQGGFLGVSDPRRQGAAEGY
jgi:gamma-glutamyltranspeptidase/glutathione hydrolase